MSDKRAIKGSVLGDGYMLNKLQAQTRRRRKRIASKRRRAIVKKELRP